MMQKIGCEDYSDEAEFLALYERTIAGGIVEILQRAQRKRGPGSEESCCPRDAVPEIAYNKRAMSTETPTHDIAAETIVAISTPPGRGGIGIVRLSGSEAMAIASELVQLRGDLRQSTAQLARIFDDAGEVIDEALVTGFFAPHSYTGEDVVEVAAHGSPVVLEWLVRRALKAGARLAEAGEFTRRAFLAGRLDLTQAEAVHDLIDAQTLTQARQAASQLGGSLSRRVMPCKQDLLELVALLEAGIDFADDDVEVTGAAEIAQRIEKIRQPLEQLEGSFAHGRLVHDGLTVALVGRPNAGKSSLFNRLLERERAIVTAMPGTTRDTVNERIAIGGIPLELVDTAGLREGEGEAERIGIERSRQAMADAEVVLVVLDSSLALNSEEEALLRELQDRAAIVVLNKCDLLSEHSAPQMDCLKEIELPQVRLSALTGEGIERLREAILKLATGGSAAEGGVLTNLRQHQAVTGAIAGLQDAAQANSNSIPHEMLLLDLYRSLWALDSLTGETTPDDVLNLIFSTFCIGK